MVLKKTEEAALENEKNAHTVLGDGTKFVGKLVFHGLVRIDGVFEGEIESDDTLILGKNAKVNGVLKVGGLAVEGMFNGKAIVKNKTELLKGSRFIGEVSSKLLVIEEGAIFNGNSKMEYDEKDKVSSIKISAVKTSQDGINTI